MALLFIILFAISAYNLTVDDRTADNPDQTEITCYSNSEKIFTKLTSRKINASLNTDSYYFIDDETSKYNQVSANCVVILAENQLVFTDDIPAEQHENHSGSNITCHSGEQLIFKGKSKNKARINYDINRFYFIDKKDNHLKEVTGNCLVES